MSIYRGDEVCLKETGCAVFDHIPWILILEYVYVTVLLSTGLPSSSLHFTLSTPSLLSPFSFPLSFSSLSFTHRYFTSMWACGRKKEYDDLEMEFLLKKVDDRRSVVTNWWMAFTIMFLFFQVTCVLCVYCVYGCVSVCLCVW